MFFCFNVKKTALLFFLLGPAMAVQALEASEAAAESASEAVAATDVKEQQRRYSFPRFPAHKQVHRDMIPPAPPGPYMSSALNRFSTDGTTFSRNKNKPAIRINPSNMSMQAFSPDVAWPSYQNSPQRWQPEDGYRFVEPSAMMPFNSLSNHSSYKKRPKFTPQVAPSMKPAVRPPVRPPAGANPQRQRYQNNNAGRSYNQRNAAMVSPAY
jgi:hypothetical protein